jgi:uncharacterized membrane protein YeaQ/YmgE (transglycosylase-associated protein family)
MTVTGIISATLIGIVVGVLGRLLVPGRQPIGMLVTILVGIVSAFIGTALGVALVSALMGRRRTGLLRAVGVPASCARSRPRRSRLAPRPAGIVVSVYARALICCTTHELPSGSVNPNSVPPSRSSTTSMSPAAIPRSMSSARAR